MGERVFANMEWKPVPVLLPMPPSPPGREGKPWEYVCDQCARFFLRHQGALRPEYCRFTCWECGGYNRQSTDYAI